MVKVFKTNVDSVENVLALKQNINLVYPYAKVSFDLDDVDNVLRVEDVTLNGEYIISQLNNAGYICIDLPIFDFGK